MPTGTAWWYPLAIFARTPRYALPRSRFLYRERPPTESCFIRTGPARLPDLSSAPLDELPDQALIAQLCRATVVSASYLARLGASEFLQQFPLSMRHQFREYIPSSTTRSPDAYECY